jgi:hypothetical protein
MSAKKGSWESNKDKTAKKSSTPLYMFSSFYESMLYAMLTKPTSPSKETSNAWVLVKVSLNVIQGYLCIRIE